MNKTDLEGLSKGELKRYRKMLYERKKDIQERWTKSYDSVVKDIKLVEKIIDAKTNS